MSKKKPKRGRRRIPDEDRLDADVYARMTRGERDRLDEAAEVEGVERSLAIRLACREWAEGVLGG